MAPRSRFDQDYYATMGLRPEATEDEIRKAYRRLALQWHPDRNPGNPAAGERFKEISEAYAVLIDPAKRGRYDAARRGGAPGGFRVSREDLFRDLFADPRASAIFEELAREFGRMGLRVDRRYFHETLFGGRAVVTGGVFVVTPFTPMLALLRLARAAMRGAGRPPVEAREATPLPRGPGMLAVLGRIGRWFLGVPDASSTSRAIGESDVIRPLRLTRIEAERGGRKRVTLPGERGLDQVLVTIPPGTRPGTRLRLRGKGRASGSGTRGDLYLAVEVGE